jgi:hypothetical protein
LTPLPLIKVNVVVNHDNLDYARYFPDVLLRLRQFGVVLICRERAVVDQNLAG